MRKLGVALAVLVALVVAGTLYYFMPRATKALITGTEVKRMDHSTASGGATRDVRYIYATSNEQKKALVFRNEDNGWYLKWDSGDIAAEASKLAKNEVDETALITYYGVRIAIFDSYPNVLSIKEVQPDYVYVPWANMVILVLLLIVFVWAGVKIRRLVTTAKSKLSKSPEGS